MRRLLAWLEREQHGGGALTRSIPGAPRRVQDWVGERLVWWPRGVPAGERVADRQFTARPSRQARPSLVRGLAAGLRELDAARQVLVSAQGTALAELLKRCSQLHRIPWLQFELARPGLSPARWLAECVTRELTPLPTVDGRWPAIVSPPLYGCSRRADSSAGLACGGGQRPRHRLPSAARRQHQPTARTPAGRDTATNPLARRDHGRRRVRFARCLREIRRPGCCAARSHFPDRVPPRRSTRYGP